MYLIGRSPNPSPNPSPDRARSPGMYIDMFICNRDLMYTNSYLYINWRLVQSTKGLQMKLVSQLCLKR